MQVLTNTPTCSARQAFYFDNTNQIGRYTDLYNAEKGNLQFRLDCAPPDYPNVMGFDPPYWKKLCPLDDVIDKVAFLDHLLMEVRCEGWDMGTTVLVANDNKELYEVDATEIENDILCKKITPTSKVMKFIEAFKRARHNDIIMHTTRK